MEEGVESSLAKAFGVVRRINPRLNTRAAAMNDAIPVIGQDNSKSNTKSPTDQGVSPRKRTLDSALTGVPPEKQSPLGEIPPPIPGRSVGRSNSDSPAAHNGSQQKEGGEDARLKNLEAMMAAMQSQDDGMNLKPAKVQKAFHGY